MAQKIFYEEPVMENKSFTEKPSEGPLYHDLLSSTNKNVLEETWRHNSGITIFGGA